MISAYGLLLVFIAGAFGALGSLILKISSSSFSLNPLKLIRNWKLIVGYVVFLISIIIFVLALREGELSIMYPLLALSYVWTALLSMRYLGEKMNAGKWLGIALIILGVFFIGLGS